MNKRSWYILLIVIIITVIVLGFFFGCAPKERTLNYHKTLAGWNVHKLDISERRANEINSQVKDSFHYYNDTMIITRRNYIDNEHLFKSGLLKNRELKKLNTKKLVYEFE